ncbi:Protein FAR1-RELATED SEQUENCE 5 [Ananas comosus]|uniref:Protein FAR1-RELATED SEQUENCE 5 n=1 Tax=Ananas comosus TaxID=4615 RepID=A0A199VX70_ANACO|nr:Protein FAR1-RELATED SEQUENCE 5 [Ananas comosus]
MHIKLDLAYGKLVITKQKGKIIWLHRITMFAQKKDITNLEHKCKVIKAHLRNQCSIVERIKMQEDSKWIVTTFEKERNHNLVTSPSKSRFLRSHRSITTEQKQVIHMLSEQNISTSQIMTFMTAREGGSQNVHFTRIGSK